MTTTIDQAEDYAANPTVPTDLEREARSARPPAAERDGYVVGQVRVPGWATDVSFEQDMISFLRRSQQTPLVYSDRADDDFKLSPASVVMQRIDYLYRDADGTIRVVEGTTGVGLDSDSGEVPPTQIGALIAALRELHEAYREERQQ